MATTVERLIIQMEARTKKAEKPLKRVENAVKKIDNVSRRGAMRFFGLGMGMLFMGMAMKRAATGALKAITAAYKIMGNEQSIFNVKTNELAAAWEFFKFSLIDALSQSDLFVALVDWLINVINWFSQLSDGQKMWILIGLAIFAAVGFLMSLVGQIGLFLIGIDMVKAGSVAALFTKIGGAIKGAAIATWAFTTALLANPLFWIIILVIALIVLLILLSKKFGGLGNALKAMVATTIVALGLLGDFLISMILVPLQLIAVAIANLMSLGGKRAPPWLVEFIEYKPNLVGSAASVAAQIQPTQQMTTTEAFDSFKNDFIDGFRAILPEMAKANADAIAQQADIIPTTDK